MDSPKPVHLAEIDRIARNRLQAERLAGEGKVDFSLFEGEEEALMALEKLEYYQASLMSGPGSPKLLIQNAIFMRILEIREEEEM